MVNKKAIIRKILCIILLMLLILNNSTLIIISEAINSTEKTINQDVKSIAEMEIEKYVNYNIDEKTKGILLQTKIQTGIEFVNQEEYKPLKATGIIVNSPKINEEYPERVYVIAKSTKSTNGKTENKEANYTYNQETGEIQIISVNAENENGEIYTQQDTNSRDIYTVIYYYSDNCYTEKVQREIEVNAQIVQQIYDKEETIITKEISTKEELLENKNDLVNLNIETSEIYNGYIKTNKTNIENNIAKQTEYTEKIDLDISYKEIPDEIEIKTENKFMNTDNIEIDTNEIIYINTKINKQDIVNILGQEGKIQILNQENQLLKEINIDTETNEEGNIEFIYDNEISEIIIKVINPIRQGTIGIENTKAIKETMTLIENNKIKTQFILTSKNYIGQEESINEKIFREYTQENIIEIQDAVTDIDISIDKTKLTNQMTNDVTITAVLKTNDAKYNLFKNPTIEIELPEKVEKIILGNVSLLYDENLKIKQTTVEENKIIIQLDGAQTQYISEQSIYHGANIIIPATVIVKKDIDSSTENIKLKYTNDNISQTRYQKAGELYDYIEVNIESIFQTPMLMALQNSEDENIDDLGELSFNVTSQVGEDLLNNGDSVYEQEVINYSIEVTNSTQNIIDDILVTADVPEGTTYVEKDGGYTLGEDGEYTLNDLYIRNTEIREINEIIDTLEIGETYTIKYKVIIEDLGELETKNLINNVNIKKDENTIYDINLNVIAKKAKLKIDLYPSSTEFVPSHRYFRTYVVKVKNLTDKAIENICIESKISEIYSYEFCSNYDIDCLSEYNDETKILLLKLGTLEAGKIGTISISVAAENFQDDIYEYNIPFSVVTYISNTEQKYRSDMDLFTAYSTGVSIIQESEKEGVNLKSSEEIEYKFSIKNEGEIGTVINVEDNLPDELIPIEAEYEYFESQDDGSYIKQTNNIGLSESAADENGNFYDFKISSYIPKGESIAINIRAKADYLGNNTEIMNYATVYGDEIHKKISNIIKNTILMYNIEDDIPQEEPEIPGDFEDSENSDEPNVSVKPEIPNDSDDVNTYSISGITWIDTNQNGLREDDEKKIEGVTVKLFNAETNAIVRDSQNKPYVTVSNSKGEYVFYGLSKGKYLVIFEIDTNEYKITEYQVKNINEAINCDAILKTASIDGINKVVGVTDIIGIQNSDIKNIDIGLIKNKEFDLSIEKYISKITQITENEKKEYKYNNNNKLAKIELDSKKIKGTVILVEYKIIVHNEGTLSGYVNEVVDYLPNGYGFVGGTIENWKYNSNGYIYTTSLVGKEIKPGESKELTVTLRKELDENSTGIIVNAAEIKDDLNIENLKDIDSITYNQNKNEDDYSEAELIIAIKTGIVRNIFIVFAFILLCILIYNLIKYKINIKFCKIIIIAVFLIFSFFTVTKAYQDLSGWAWVWDHTVNQTRYVYRYQYNIKLNDVGYHIRQNNGIWQWKDRSRSDFNIYTYDWNKFWCISPDRIVCNYDWHKYRYHDYWKNGYDSNGYPIIDEYTSKATVSAAQYSVSMPDYDYVDSWDSLNASQNSESQLTTTMYSADSSKVIIGPYKISTNSKVSSTVSLTVRNQSGSTIAYTVCNAAGNTLSKVPSNGEFYLLIDRNTIRVNVTATINGNSSWHKKGLKVYLFFGYYTSEEVKAGNHSSSCVDSSWQNLIKFQPFEYYKTKNITGSLYWSYAVDLPVGSLKILKLDSRTNTQISGAIVKITGPNNYSKNEYITSSGSVINDLVAGTYVVEEVVAPTMYNLSLQSIFNKKKTVTIENGKQTEVKLYNTQYGNLQIIKQDTDTSRKLAGIGFKILNTSNNTYIKINNASTVTGTVTLSSPGYITSASKSNATTFYTDSNGQILIKNLPLKTYRIEEYSIPSSLKDYYVVNNENTFVTLGTNINQYGKERNTTVTIKNKQKYITLSGYVWQDNEINSKNGSVSTSNGTYNTEDGDKKIQGITVNLKYKEDTNSEETIIKTTITDAEGKYSFKGVVEKDKLNKYNVEFVYDGLTYTSVTVNKIISNGSYVKEVADDRVNLNSKFTSVTGTSIPETLVGTANSSIQNVKNEIGLTYIKNEDLKTTTYNNIWTYTDKGSYIIAESKDDIYDITGTTKEAEYTLTSSLGQKEIANVNFGLKKREMSNMLIYNHDIDNVKVSINNHTNIYKYDQNAQNADMNNLLNGQLVLQVPTYERAIHPSYIRSIDDLNENELKIYVTYKITIKNKSNTLTMGINEIVNYYDEKYDENNINVGYKINTEDENYYGLVNESKDEVKNQVNKLEIKEISETYNNNYNIDGDNYKTSYITGEGIKPIVILEHGQEANIFIQYEVKRECVKNILNSEQTLNQIAEIYSYTTFDRNDAIYAAVDIDSAVGNAKPGIETEKYENDTDISPTIKLVVGDERIISGNVFEDLPENITKDIVNQNKNRIGNGIYDTNESAIKDVLVQLVPVDMENEATPSKTYTNNDTVSYIYPNDNLKYKEKFQDNNKAVAAMYTDEDGTYVFNGVVPGHYRIKFTYGDKVIYGDEINNARQSIAKTGDKITVEEYKSTIRAGDIYTDKYWYQNDVNKRYSDALDDYSLREQSNVKLSNINYGIKTSYENIEKGNGLIHSISSYTDVLDIAIQDKEKAVIQYMNETPNVYIKNVDFGIIERPKQEIQISKEISHVKVTLANGQILIEGDPRNEILPYVSYPRINGNLLGQLKIEMDNEILHGSTLEIEYEIAVENLSEIDYNDESYYKYGKIAENNKDNALVKTTITKIIDYLDNKLATTYKYDKVNNQWYELTSAQLSELYNLNKLYYNNKYQQLSTGAYNKAKEYKSILMIENSESLKDIKPGETKTVKLTASKLLTNTYDDLTFENYVEILEEKNDVGKFMENSTPGNYEVKRGPKELDDNSLDGKDKNSVLTIIPPTGQTRIYYILGISVLLIVVTGIIFIKKKVLDK